MVEKKIDANRHTEAVNSNTHLTPPHLIGMRYLRIEIIQNEFALFIYFARKPML